MECAVLSLHRLIKSSFFTVDGHLSYLQFETSLNEDVMNILYVSFGGCMLFLLLAKYLTVQ